MIPISKEKVEEVIHDLVALVKPNLGNFSELHTIPNIDLLVKASGYLESPQDVSCDVSM